MADLAHFAALSKESVWSDKHTYDAVETRYYEMKSGTSIQVSELSFVKLVLKVDF